MLDIKHEELVSPIKKFFSLWEKEKKKRKENPDFPFMSEMVGNRLTYGPAPV